MALFQKCYENGEYNESIEELVNVSKDIEALDWEDVFWLAKCIQSADTELDTDEIVINKNSLTKSREQSVIELNRLLEHGIIIDARHELGKYLMQTLSISGVCIIIFLTHPAAVDMHIRKIILFVVVPFTRQHFLDFCSFLFSHNYPPVYFATRAVSPSSSTHIFLTAY